MILTCPSCSTRYFTGEASLGPQGRLVRCAACQHTWRARDDDAPASAGETDDDSGLIEALDADDLAAETEPAPGDPKPAERPLTPGAPNMRAVLLGWSGAGAGVIALVALAVLFRVEIVGLWPRTASAYAVAGFEVTAEGLVFQNVAASPGYSAGEPTLTITADVRNTSRRARPVPPVRIGLFDREGREVFAWSVSLGVAELEPRRAARFTAMLAQPPADAEDLELRFDRRGGGGDLTPAATELVE